jgi:hypothetical protein
MLGVLHQPHVPGHGVDPRFRRQPLGLDLVPHGADGRGGRTDEGDPGLVQRFDEGCILGEEAEAGVNRLGAGIAAGGDDPIDAQVAVSRRRGSDVDRFVGHLDVQAVDIDVGIDGNARHSHAPRAADDAARDLAAVGN